MLYYCTDNKQVNPIKTGGPFFFISMKDMDLRIHRNLVKTVLPNLNDSVWYEYKVDPRELASQFRYLIHNAHEDLGYTFTMTEDCGVAFNNVTIYENSKSIRDLIGKLSMLLAISKNRYESYREAYENDEIDLSQPYVRIPYIVLRPKVSKQILKNTQLQVA